MHSDKSDIMAILHGFQTERYRNQILINNAELQTTSVLNALNLTRC